MTNKKLYLILLLVWIVFLEITTFLWILFDKSPPLWDQANYLKVSNDFYYGLKTQGLSGLSSEWLSAIEIKPPLLSLLVLPFYLIFGHSQFSASLLYLVLIALFNIFLFLLVRELFKEKIALISTVIASTMPLVFGLSRQFFVEYSLMVLVIIWLYLLLKSDFLKNNRYNLLLGILLGLGLLLQITFVIFIIGPLIIILFYRLKSKQLKNIYLNLGITLTTGALIALSWYWRNFITFWKFITDGGLSDIRASLPWTEKLSNSWIMSIPNNISFYYFIFIILLGTIYLCHFISQRKKVKLSKGLLIISSWLIIPFLFFSILQTSVFRYTLTIYPSIAIILGWLLVHVVKKSSLIVIFFIIPLIFYYLLSFNSGALPNKDIYLGKILFFSKNAGEFYYSFDKSPWSNKNILDLISKNWHFPSKALILMVDHKFLNHSNMDYYASLTKNNLQFEWFGCSENAQELEQLGPRINQANFLITKTGVQGPEGTNCLNLELQKALDTKSLPFGKIATFPLPDDSEAFVYQQLK